MNMLLASSGGVKKWAENMSKNSGGALSEASKFKENTQYALSGAKSVYLQNSNVPRPRSQKNRLLWPAWSTKQTHPKFTDIFSNLSSSGTNARSGTYLSKLSGVLGPIKNFW